MRNILVSACLLGIACRYDGQSKEYSQILELLKRDDINLIPVCPEQLGGLSTPRHPSEILGDKLINDIGEDVTYEYHRGAQETLKICQLYDCDVAILKEKSPSCGCGLIYDGTFSRKLVEGNGVTADLLIANGIKVIGESQVGEKRG